MRVLVTGSTTWSGIYLEQRVNTILYTVLSLHDQIAPDEKMTIVYGTEYAGVAGIVDRWVLRNEQIGERLPIDNVASNKALASAAMLGRIDLWLAFLDDKDTVIQHTRISCPIVPHVIRAN